MKTLTILIAFFTALPLVNQAQVNSGDTTSTADPYTKEDGSWIAIRGTVESVAADQFMLNYGDGTIQVRLDTENTTDEHTFILDEEVRVFGIVDEGFFQNTSILARAVFVESLSRVFYATDGVQEFIRISTPGLASGSVVQGTITSVSENNIRLDEGDRMITVDTSTLPDDSLDRSTMKEGDRIAVVGNMDRGFFTGRTLRATSILPLDGPDDENMQGSGRDHLDSEY